MSYYKRGYQNNKFLYDVAKKLIETAENHGTISYSELSESLGSIINPRNIKYPIMEVSEKCHKLNLPLLSALVVNKETGMPGEGFFELLKDLRGAVPNDAWEKECTAIWNFREWNILLEYFN